MNVEFSKEQKNLLAEKIALCVEFLKENVQPHLTAADKLSAGVGEFMDLYITSKEIYVKETQVINFIIEFYPTRVLYLEKPARKKASKYICEANPELAVDFLKHWEDAKRALLAEVADKNQQVDTLNKFIDDFRL